MFESLDDFRYRTMPTRSKVLTTFATGWRPRIDEPLDDLLISLKTTTVPTVH